ncbi:hypothetical protein Gohar_016636, partial [Gossypium harknessii]|nr:hypothetical protein [Gossypium harknessii]
MKIISNASSLIILYLFISAASVQIHGQGVPERRTCFSRRSPCFLKTMTCPSQCPSTKPSDRKAK